MTWSQIVRRARELHERYESGGSLAWYRGQRQADWTLLSAGHRYIQELVEGVSIFEGEASRIKLVREELKAVYRRFQSDAWNLLSENERTSWGVLFTMQHFGLPTRLMDWTESFACAVFFAQLDRLP